MNFISAPVLRRLIPAGALVAVLAFSYLGPLPSAASSVGGFGYNCGVKGYGYHDHGKVCPNRPFPGKGIGITKVLSNGITTSTGISSKPSHGNGTTPSVTIDTTRTSGDAHAQGNGHGSGRGRGKGKSQFNL